MKSEHSPLAEGIKVFDARGQERILKAVEVCGDGAAGTADILIHLGMDADAVIAAVVLGHFTDKPPPPSALGDFGPVVAHLVKGVKAIEALPVECSTIQEAQNIRSLIFALADDIKAIIIKLAKECNALRAAKETDDESRKTLARSCLDIYAPLADRLGIYWMKDELEDLSLKYLNREAYQHIKTIVAQKKEKRGEFLDHVHKTISTAAREAGINASVTSRAKHFYSVYMKMRKRGKSAEELYDLSGIRVICDSIEDCYTLLGIVHRLWEPAAGCFDDYVAKPKPNGYQSLHTSVLVDLDGEPRRLEIQIRTWEMHHLAENGVASHWLYKKGSSRDMVEAQDIGVVNRLKGWKDEKGQSGEGGEAGERSDSWLADIKREILRDSIYVRTPQGKVLKLPTGATPVDFAYQVHSAIGDHCIGAKANGVIVPLSAELKNTQVVEILTSPSARPHLGWLETVKTTKARSKIRSWLERNDPATHAEKQNEKNAEKKKAVAEAPLPAVVDEKDSPMQRVLQPLASAMQVRIQDEKSLLVRFARCCNPVTGDAIVGYVSRGRGVIIHRSDCASLAKNPEFEKRKIEAAWEKASSPLMKHFRIDARYSANLFSEIEGAIRRRQGHLIEGRIEEEASLKEGAASRLTGFFTIQLGHADDLKPVMKNIRAIPGIIAIRQLS